MIFSIFSRQYRWKYIRKQHLNIQPTCRACGSNKSLQVHHIVPVSVDKSKELDNKNLITLCKTCHFVFGHLMDWHSWNVDVINDSMVYYNKIINKPYNTKIRCYGYNNKSIINNFYSIMLKIIDFWNYRSRN